MTSNIANFFASLGDLDAACDLITADAQFIAVREKSYAELPLYGTFIGPQGLREFVAGLRTCFDTQFFQIDHVIENTDIGSAFGRFDHIIRDTGQHFVSHWAVLCTFEKGLISSYRFYEDNAALEEAMQRRTTCKEEIK